MKLIVGLGNPGDKYDGIRHNIGFMLLDKYITGFSLNKKFNALEKFTNYGDEKVLFIKPLSFMNLSGEVVKRYIDYYKIDINDLYVIQDDLDMDVGKIKICYNHNSGGHNGIKNIIECIGSKTFVRIKIGIGRSSNDIIDYVLTRFSKEDYNTLNNSFEKLNNIFDDIVNMSVDRLMNKYNSL